MKWISVEKRLPRKDQECYVVKKLFMEETTQITIGYFYKEHTSTEINKTYTNTFFDAWDMPMHGVTYWIPSIKF